MESKKTTNILMNIIILSMICTLCYYGVRISIVVVGKYTWYESILAMLLVFAESFIILQAIGYALEVYPVLLKAKEKKETPSPLKEEPEVAIIIPSYEEPVKILQNTLFLCHNLNYKNKRIFLLDDTRYDLKKNQTEEMKKYKQDLEDLCKELKVNIFRHKWRGAKAGIINDFLTCLKNKFSGDDCELICFDEKGVTTPKYMVVLDSDQNPFMDFLDHLVPQIETDENIAFIQTPQYYTNSEINPVARAAAMQQVIFYEYICEGKSTKNATYCCGTNVIFRLDALYDVGGFDEGSITEDFATSLVFHARGWRTLYDNKVGVFGRGPEDLGGFFKQQFRWALGTLRQGRKLLSLLFVAPRTFTLAQWWEYFLSVAFYFTGFVYLILVICPILYLIFDVPSYFARIEVYGAVFIPYLVFSFTTFFLSLTKRGYKIKDIITGQFLIALSFPVFIKAVWYAFSNKKIKFAVTTKGGEGEKYPLRHIFPQMLLATCCLISVIWALNRIIYEQYPIGALVVTAFWSFYNFVFLSTINFFATPRRNIS